MPNRQTVFLSSSARINGSISDCQIKLPVNLFNAQPGEEIHVHLLRFSIKNTYLYIDSNRNNEFTLTEDGLGSTTVTLTPGTYDIKELRAEIETQINTGFTTLGSSWTIALTYNKNTFRYTFAIAGSGGDVDITFTTDRDAHEILGFANATDTLTLTTAAPSASSNTIISIGNEEEIHIHCNKAESLHLASGQDALFGNQLATIPIEVGAWSTVIWENLGAGHVFGFHLPAQSKTDQIISFKLTNEHGLTMDFAADWHMVLRVQAVPAKETSLNDVAKLLAIGMTKG